MIANDLKVDDENEKVGSQDNKRRKRKHGSVSKNDTTPGPFDVIIDATNRHHFARTIYDFDLDAGPFWVEILRLHEQLTRSLHEQLTRSIVLE
jgi:hypothetical protein